MRPIKGITSLTDEKEDELVDRLIYCFFCNEPFKECDTIKPGVGVIVGETDVKKYKGRYWHWGCIYDYEKMDKPERAEWREWKRVYKDFEMGLLNGKPDKRPISVRRAEFDERIGSFSWNRLPGE